MASASSPGLAWLACLAELVPRVREGQPRAAVSAAIWASRGICSACATPRRRDALCPAVVEALRSCACRAAAAWWCLAVR